MALLACWPASMEPDDANRTLAALRDELEDTERMFQILSEEVDELESGSAEPEPEIDDTPVELGSFSMILFKHSGSADPSCWRTHRSIDRSVDESRNRLAEVWGDRKALPHAARSRHFHMGVRASLGCLGPHYAKPKGEPASEERYN